ncbi:MAG: PKD domain-containing protein, partial [Salinivirgaceae bacterium]
LTETKKACFGLTNGEALTTPTGGSGSYTYLWDNGKGTAATATGLDPTVLYNVTITDANHTSCTITKNITVTENTDITLLKTNSNYNSFGVSCFGASDGWIKVVPSNGTSPYSYQWNANAGSQITQKAEGLPIGSSFAVTVTDAIGCTKVSPNYSLDQPVALSITETITHVTYNGGNNGQIQISVPDTSGTSNLYWTGFNTVNGLGTQTGLTAGSYQVTVVDRNNCSANESYTVNQPAAPLQGGEISYGGVKTDYACYQTTSFAFSNVLGYSDGNIDSAYVYSWQYSTNGSTWTTIPATNADIYTRSTVLTQDLYYRRAVTNAGVTAYSDTIFLDYIANPGLAYSGLNTEYCKNASNVTLIGTPTTSYGTFVGTGIISTADGIATFSPTATDTSTFPNPISVIYRYNEHGCITELTKTTTIQPVPVPDFFLPNKISKSVGSHTIDGQSPTGGTFTGTNTTPEGVFYVSSLTPGPYDITYSVTNIYGCSHSTLKTTEVVEGIGSITVNGSGTNNDKFCIDGATQLIYATPAFNDDYYGYFLAPVTDMGDKQHGTLDPTTLTAGTHILQYTYSGTLGTFTIEQEITVYDVTNEAKIMGIESPYCNYNQIEAINANPLLNGDVGVFSGTGITDGTDGTATFNVATALGSSPVTIKYVYTQNISGCKDSVTQSVTVNPQPPVSFDTKTLFNRLGEVYKFQNIIPYGGIFEGEGISRSDSTFNPAAAKMGNNPVTYIFTDVKGCKDTAHYTLLVENAKGTIDGLPANKIYCKDGSNDKLFYTPADADSYIPVKMEIDGTTMSSNDTVTILPSTLSGGTHTVKSTYLGSDGITEFWISENFQIDDIGTLGINVPKTDYCNYNGSVTLKGKLNGVDVAWGTFSGSGVNTDLTNDGNATFLPTAAYEGVNSIYYTYTSKTTLSTCYKTDSTVITVHPRPTVDFTLKPLYSDKGAEEPIVVTPTGGYFEPTSLFINNTIFRPLVAGAADHTLTYNFTDGYSCFNSLSKVAKVVSAKGTIEGLNDYNIYCSDGINDTIYYKAPDADAHTPVSFTLDGNIIKTNSDTAIITPTLLTSGDHALKYTYKGSDGVTSFTLEQTITIDKIGNLDVLFDNEFCEYETASTLTGRIDLSIAARGVFTGTGIDPVDTDNDGIASFDPTKATVGTNTITYSYPSTRTNSTCTKSYNFNITVHPRPTLDFALKTLYSNKGADEPLAGIPSKGKFTPSGLFINDTIFRPSVAGAGDHTLTYKYTDGYSCSDSLSKVAKVVSAKGSIIGLNDYNIYCSDGINDTIHYVAPDGDAHTPINFTLDGNILSTASDFATIKPSELTPGPHILKYTYKGSDDSTPFTLEQTITIDKIGNIDINLPNDKYCEYEGAVILIGKLDGANVNRGYFNGKGIVDSETNGGDGSATFDPTQADLNNNTITYTYPSTNGASSCKKSIDTVITVNPKPELFFSVPNIINRLGGDYTLEATPAGGTFGPESYVEGVIFKPSLVPELGYLTLTYTNKDVNNCRDTVEYTTEIQDPTGTFFGVQTQYCYDAGNVTINVANINNIKPGTGYFHGAGIISTNGLQATFNPQVAWDDVSGDTTVKTITLYYTYKGTNDSTEFTISTTTKVRNNGKVKFPNLSANKSYCRNVLTPLTATPPGGDFFGICMVVNVFHPEKAHADSLTTQVTYTYSQGGCSIDSMVTLNLLDIPVLSLDFQSSICANAPADTIVGFPRGGKITGSNLSLDYFEGLEDSVRFSPKPSDVGEITKITYTYMDTTTLCSNTKTDTITVNEIPAISIQLAIPEKGFCNVNVDYPIIGLYNGAPAPTGIFDGAGVVTSPPNSGKGIFNPNSAGVNNANPILFTFIDNNSCENTVDTVTIINPLPDISLSYIADAYCSDYGELNISGSAPLGTYIMKINEISQAGKDKTITISDYANFDSIMIVFQATSSATNCTNTVTDTIQINHIPDVAFTYSDICIADSIKFNYTGDTPDNMIKSYSWNFGVDENSISAEKDPSYKYVTPKNVHVVLKVTDNLECFASADSLLELELNPQASFDWENECFNESKKIQFTNNNSYSPFYNYYWDFDDNSTSSEHKPEHAFPGTGAYHVKYVISSNNSKCTDTLTKTIHIRPTYVVSELNDNSYSQSFEDKPDGWIHETLVEGDDVDSWEWGDPVGKFSLSTANGQKVYGTGLTGLYKANENSAVTSPCFDLSGLERPMISLSTFSWMENGTDGAVLESSINDGKEWEIVGSVNSGINWYNDHVIKQTPGDNQGQGWTGNTQNWVVARHDLDALVGQKNVRFRIAFASDEIKEYEGFAFDNIKIGNRTRRVLIEHFSNYKKENSYSTDSVINKIREKNPADAIDILYESSISDSNQLYLKYPVGVKARETYYNVTQVPYSYFDGTTSFNFSGANTPTSTNLMSKALVDPLFQLNVSTQVEGASIKIKLDMKALADIESRQLQLFTAIVEEEVELVHANKTLTFHNVLRRFVPSPAGEYIETSWLKNDSVTYNFTYQINNYVVDAEKLVVVAFVQDENNLEVLQSATSDTTTNTPVSIEDYFAKSQKLDMMLFPNPTQGEVYLVLSQVPDNSSVVEVINQQGKVVQRAKPTAEQQLKLETQSLVQGIYFVRWVNNGNQVIKKLVVFH